MIKHVLPISILCLVALASSIGSFTLARVIHADYQWADALPVIDACAVRARGLVAVGEFTLHHDQWGVYGDAEFDAVSLAWKHGIYPPSLTVDRSHGIWATEGYKHNTDDLGEQIHQLYGAMQYVTGGEISDTWNFRDNTDPSYRSGEYWITPYIFVKRLTISGEPEHIVNYYASPIRPTVRDR